eukprot:TRINITY_DN1006_c0_g1_i3.p2 TRINITY_DN1006_c0_g1~~TRINITY_DN1006_c0_g1_i3.p2  ORF type:complete len:311 (-),score=45.43 TRINITY_DN1006_c0_g1_i3:279-1211(-)
MNMQLAFLLLGLYSASGQLTTLQIAAQGATDDGSTASALGQGVGAIVQGDGVIKIDDKVSASSVVLTASGSAPKPKPKPTPRPIVKPKPTPVVKSKPTPVVKPAPSKYYVTQKPTCVDVKDDICFAIDTYDKCGFCLLNKYPIKGHGCPYIETYVKKGDKKSGDDYEVRIEPKCKCDGVLILDGKACPSCDTLLAKILKCAGKKKTSGAIEIPQRCLKEVGVTKEVLVKCGLLKKPDPKPAKKDVVVVYPDHKPSKKNVVVVDPVVTKNKPVVVVPKKPTIATATATASAVSTGGIATASSDAIATSGRK